MRITNRRGFMKDPRLRSTYQRLLSGRQGGRRPVAGQDPNRAMQAVNATQGAQTQRASSGYRSDGPGQRMQNFHRNRSNEQGGIGRPARAGYRGFRNPERTANRFRNYGQFRRGLNEKLRGMVASDNVPTHGGGFIAPPRTGGGFAASQPAPMPPQHGGGFIAPPRTGGGYMAPPVSNPIAPGPVTFNPSKRDKRGTYIPIPTQPPRQAWM